MTGWGGYPLVGTPEQITEELTRMSNDGLDGVVVSWIDYRNELPQFADEVLPLLEQAGVRTRSTRRTD